MNTFLPFQDFAQSALVLDNKRLHNQANEALIILRTITGWYKERGKRGWPHHPATKMWKGHSYTLYEYYRAVVGEIIKREVSIDVNNVKENIISFWSEMYDPSETEAPTWLGDERLHSSHRASLLAKDYDWYSQFGWVEEPEINYFWPTEE